MFFVVMKSIPDAGNAMKAEASINEGQGTKDVKIDKDLVSFIKKRVTNALIKEITLLFIKKLIASISDFRFWCSEHKDRSVVLLNCKL